MALPGCVSDKPVSDEVEKIVPGTALMVQDWQNYDWSAVKDPYADGQLFAYLDSTPVTMEELERFNIRILGDQGSTAHGGQGEMGVFNALPAFRRYLAVISEAERLGLDKDPRFVKRFEFTIRTALAQPYRNWLLENAAVGSEELQEKLPQQWVRMNFAMKAFATEEAVKAAAEAITGQDSFYAYEGAVTVAGKSVPETGLIFPGSGFFEEWDDVDLFKLQEGDVHGPVKTGVGYSIVLVVERDDMDETEISDYITKIRTELSQAYAAEEWETFGRQRVVEIDEDTLQQAIFREFAGSGYSRKTVVTVDDDTIDYRLFRLLNGKNYSSVKNNLPRTYWKNPVKADLGNVINQVIMGKLAQEAIREGRWTEEIPPAIVKSLYDYRRTYFYYSFMDLVRDELAVEVSDDEARQFYRDNLELFLTPAKADVIYRFAIDEQVAGKWKDVLASGGSFGDAANATPVTKAPHDKEGDGYTRSVVYQGDNLLADLQEELFTMRTGETRILKGTMGYYLMHMDEFTMPTHRPVEESLEQARSNLVDRRISEAIAKRVDALAATIKVDIVGDLPEAPPEQDIPNPDLG
jgi:hypothetical protein